MYTKEKKACFQTSKRNSSYLNVSLGEDRGQ